MNKENKYRELFADLPEAVYEPLQFTGYPEEEMLQRARDWYEECERRRTTRHFSTKPVAKELIELAIATANTAPSGAHLQPWKFVAIDSPALKQTIRDVTEEEEYKTYTERMTDEWRQDLAKLGTDWVKTHITDAPWVVVLFKERYSLKEDGKKKKHYYVDESVGICAGLFISAIHHMGLSTLTHTPNPMGFLNELLKRPPNESAVLLFPVGYPSDTAQVPKIARKPLEDIVQWNDG
ncbi:MAG: nitroreductase family protein [Gammaproteobacteria bacterium]|jgi:iodotyrosine deiodinase|nr:nitroreductase family protein [Gammaproteobacteria bacterium]